MDMEPCGPDNREPYPATWRAEVCQKGREQLLQLESPVQKRLNKMAIGNSAQQLGICEVNYL